MLTFTYRSSSYLFYSVVHHKVQKEYLRAEKSRSRRMGVEGHRKSVIKKVGGGEKKESERDEGGGVGEGFWESFRKNEER